MTAPLLIDRIRRKGCPWRTSGRWPRVRDSRSPCRSRTRTASIGRTMADGPRRPALVQQAHQGPVDQQTLTVHGPEGNVLNVEALWKLMEQSRRGEI